ncbi:MAG: hypothetical protein ACKVWV_14500 [Planctomycetota bacterium]
MSAIALVVALSSGCASSRWYDYRFAPAPIEVEVAAAAMTGTQVRTLVSVLGIARESAAGRDQAEIRMRLENLGTVPATLVESGLSLVSADLQSFGPGELVQSVDTPSALTVPPGGHAVFDVHFALPGGQKPSKLDLSGLNLRWTLDFAGTSVTTGATFQLQYFEVYDPWYPRWSVGVGYVHH